MISFRQHVVTIVAIFLALALGVLAGSAFVQPRLIETLETQADRDRQTIADLRDQLAEMGDLVAAERAFNDVALPHLTAGRLLGQQVLVVAQDGVEDDLVAGTRQALEEAGATAVVLSARDALAPQDVEGQDALAQLLSLPGADPTELPSLAAEALATRLATDGRREPATDDDLLYALLTEGYLASMDASLTDPALAGIGGPDQIVIVLSGGLEEDAVMPPDAFAVPLVQRLAELGLPVAAGESVDTVVPFVSVLRGIGVDGVVTVDDLDESRGGAALVLGLQRRVLTGEGGDYGVKDGAAPLPPPP